MRITIETSEMDDKVLAHYYSDPKARIRSIVAVDIESHRRRLSKERLNEINNNPETLFNDMFAEPGYQNKKEKEDEVKGTQQT